MAKQYASKDNIEEIFKLIGEGTVHKKYPVIIDNNGQYIDLLALLNKLCSKNGINISDYKISSTLYTISVKINNLDYYFYPIYDKEKDYCIYALTNESVTNNKIYNEIHQKPISDADGYDEYIYICTSKYDNNAISQLVNGSLQTGWLNNNCGIMSSREIIVDVDKLISIKTSNGFKSYDVWKLNQNNSSITIDLDNNDVYSVMKTT